MSVQPIGSGVTPWWPAAPQPSREASFPPAAAGDHARAGAGIPLASAVLGGIGLMLSAAGFFLSSSPAIVVVLACAALAGVAGGAVLGVCGVRRPLGEVAVIGIAAAGLGLPLAIFDLLIAVSGHLG